MTTAAARDQIMRYWHSWQTPTDFEETRRCLADDVVFDGGAMQIEGGDAVIQMMSANPVPWADVELVSELYSDDGGAIVYEGTVSTTGVRMRVAEQMTLRDGLIASVIAVMTQKDANPFADA